ncbi:penicillin-binding protein [Streptomyces sp. AJS327]|uniref:transglycosylase domain-containing protein n=1 Tax=Streptomyces sp. AJS327 TaxID=2545265 RepID=UPI0015DF174E|nr:transglycosylase domain-containing protein [Streptomyces sp. AJS327]MBA0052832.1 penicillin-binding protein [Streptomyces sp. AJS327]
MSEHRRKPPQGRGRRAAQQPPASGRAAASHGASPTSNGSRAAARRAAPRATGGSGGRRRATGQQASVAAGAGAGGARGGGGGGRRGGGTGEGPRGPRGRGRPEPPKKRLIDYPRSTKQGMRRWMPSWKQVLGLCVAFLGLLVGLVGIGLWMVQVPDAQAAAKSEKNVYYWSDKSQMAVAGGGDENRQVVPLSKIPQSMQWAVIAAENETFYQDKGVDPMGIARAVARMATGGDTQSGSTITQQYVKNTYLDNSQTVSRKVKELFISIKVGAKEDKPDILSGYLNTAYYGRGAYGIQSAAQAYYGVDSDKLDPSQSAFLSAVLNGPNLYDPAGGYGSIATKEKNESRAKARWKWTLDRQVEIGKMSKSDRDRYVGKGFPDPDPPKPATGLKGQKGYMVELANNSITSNPDTGITKQQLDKGGYKIYTTFDKKKTGALKRAVETVEKRNIDAKKRPKTDKYVQFGGASVKPGDGAIQAIYGGSDATKHFNNNADYTGVQVGSTFKPFVLAAAMKDGVRNPAGPEDQGEDQRKKVSPTSVYDGDNKIKLRDYRGEIWHDKDGKEWHQKNDGGKDYGKVDLRTAMQHSVNTPFIQLGMDVGLKEVKAASVRAGLKDDASMASLTPTFSLGTSAPSAIRMANAYGTFAKSGMAAEPYSVTRIEKEGEPPYEHDAETKPAFDPAVANNVTSVLETVVKKGTGTAAQGLNRPAAGKTGTTDDNRSAWFSGYTPQLSTTIGMWRADDQAKNPKFLSMFGTGGQKKIHGASFPAEIWTAYMTGALKGTKALPFPEPTPIGEKVYGDGASPTPQPTPTDTPEEPEPSDEPSESPSDDEDSPSPTPDPTDTCADWDIPCKENEGQTGGDGGADNGGQNGGQDGGGGDGGADGGPGNGGNDNGGIFGGPMGARTEE